MEEEKEKEGIMSKEKRESHLTFFLWTDEKSKLPMSK